MLLLLLALATQRPDSLGAAVRKVARISSARVVLEHVNVIDGTGTAATPDRNITIEVEIVFKDGVGYDTAKLLESVRAGTGSISGTALLSLFL